MTPRQRAQFAAARPELFMAMWGDPFPRSKVEKNPDGTIPWPTAATLDYGRIFNPDYGRRSA